jgi:selenocysteine-specific elongation factor
MGAFLNTTTKLPDVYFTLATAGHVDHGKTSLIKALTGTNPDRLKEEQERQMTTDLGFAHLILPAPGKDGAAGIGTLGLGFIDVPGHGKFLKNMLAGVGGIELALLVVAADEGPMPQTVQHIKILSLLGVSKAVVALTKADLVDQSRCAIVETKVRALLERFNISVVGLECVSTVKGENGQGIAALKETLAKTLANLNLKPSSASSAPSSPAPVSSSSSSSSSSAPAPAAPAPPAPASPPASSKANAAPAAAVAGYLPIDRVFAKSGYGTVVTGTLVEGSFKVGDQVTIEPGGVAARIRGLETFGQAQEVARAGQRLAINLSAKEHKVTLIRGLCVLGGTKNVTSDLFLHVLDFGAENDSDEGAEKKYKLTPQPIKLYHGTMEAAGSLRWLE